MFLLYYFVPRVRESKSIFHVEHFSSKTFNIHRLGHLDALFLLLSCLYYNHLTCLVHSFLSLHLVLVFLVWEAERLQTWKGEIITKIHHFTIKKSLLRVRQHSKTLHYYTVLVGKEGEIHYVNRLSQLTFYRYTFCEKLCFLCLLNNRKRKMINIRSNFEQKSINKQ